MKHCVLSKVQREVGEWAKQFGDNQSQHPLYEGAKLFSIPPFLGMVEELGELAAPLCKRHQGRGFTNHKEYVDAVGDALADLIIFMCDFANRENIYLSGVLEEVWSTVKQRSQRTWAHDKEKEKVEAIAEAANMSPPTESEEQTGQGWSEPTEEQPDTPKVAKGHYLSPSYSQSCKQCGRPVHRSNTSSICTNCSVKNRSCVVPKDQNAE